ncbi:unnamed protein product, partial [marine sediment metagenome]
NGVAIVAYYNVPSRLATDASALYSRNIYNFVELLTDSESKQLAIDWDDEIVKGTLVAKGGAVVHPALTGETAPAPEETSDDASGDDASGDDADKQDAGQDDSGKGA